MKIIDLKEKYNLTLVYDAAIKNSNVEDIYLSRGFSWDSTTEGFLFWNFIHKGKFEEARKICPHLFVDEKIGSDVAELESLGFVNSGESQFTYDSNLDIRKTVHNDKFEQSFDDIFRKAEPVVDRGYVEDEAKPFTNIRDTLR